VRRYIEQVLDFYNIRHSVDYVITDNAANMRKAMTLTLQAIQSTDDTNGMDEDEDVDDPEMWENLNEADADEVNSTMTAHCRFERLSCFDHTLKSKLDRGRWLERVEMCSDSSGQIMQDYIVASHECNIQRRV